MIIRIAGWQAVQDGLCEHERTLSCIGGAGFLEEAALEKLGEKGGRDSSPPLVVDFPKGISMEVSWIFRPITGSNQTLFPGNPFYRAWRNETAEIGRPHADCGGLASPRLHTHGCDFGTSLAPANTTSGRRHLGRIGRKEVGEQRQ